ncbi:unnamed protein product, partial [Didymodactylos carnosus]
PNALIKDVVVQPKLDRSDHSFIEFKMNTLACKGRRVRTIYDYGAVNWEQVIARFLDIPVERLLKNYNSLNEKVQVFEEILLEHIKTYVPSKEIMIELRDKAWFNDELRVLYKKKLKLYRKRNNSTYHLQLYHEKAAAAQSGFRARDSTTYLLNALEIIYKACVLSILNYGSIIYSLTTSVNLNKVEHIQYEAAMAICGTMEGTSKDRLYEILGWISTKKHFYILRLLTFFKIIKGRAPAYLINHLQFHRP